MMHQQHFGEPKSVRRPHLQELVTLLKSKRESLTACKSRLKLTAGLTQEICSALYSSQSRTPLEVELGLIYWNIYYHFFDLTNIFYLNNSQPSPRHKSHSDRHGMPTEPRRFYRSQLPDCQPFSVPPPDPFRSGGTRTGHIKTHSPLEIKIKLETSGSFWLLTWLTRPSLGPVWWRPLPRQFPLVRVTLIACHRLSIIRPWHWPSTCPLAQDARSEFQLSRR